MTRRVKFNVNDKVRVKLTPIGVAALKRRDEKLGFEAWLPKEDEDGWSEWQLWALMEELGEHCHCGSSPPFETEIEFMVKD